MFELKKLTEKTYLSLFCKPLRISSILFVRTCLSSLKQLIAVFLSLVSTLRTLLDALLEVRLLSDDRNFLSFLPNPNENFFVLALLGVLFAFKLDSSIFSNFFELFSTLEILKLQSLDLSVDDVNDTDCLDEVEVENDDDDKDDEGEMFNGDIGTSL